MPSLFFRCVWIADGSVAWSLKVSRQKLRHTLRQFPPQTLIAMEACLTSHFWGRTLISMGYDVKLIPTQHVKAFARHQKNDANDALAICETARRPGIHLVSVKTTEQQDIKARMVLAWPVYCASMVSKFSKLIALTAPNEGSR